MQADRRLRGVSAVHPLPVGRELQFVSGGYDHVVDLWTVEEDLQSAKAISLSVTHSSLIQSMTTIKDSSLKLITAGADCLVNVWDLQAEISLRTIRTSNSVYQLHPTALAECVLAEVRTGVN